MINLCKQCKNNGSKFMCGNCSGNPKLSDNFSQKELVPLNEIVANTGYKFGSIAKKEK